MCVITKNQWICLRVTRSQFQSFQYLKSLAGGGGSGSSASSSSGVDTSGFTMSGDINMNGNEIVGLDDQSNDSSVTSKKYVDAKVSSGGGLDQATADNRVFEKDTRGNYVRDSNRCV